MTEPDELAAAARTLRNDASLQAATTAMPAVAALLRAREPLAAWLDHIRTTALELHRLHADPGRTVHVQPHALDIARAINRTRP
ncbi:hypothetical protein [Streptomyces aureocirculatus]|uniref:hypothetical protein n=1 Tax=Streptomyces aureocirculatus TaxID=67275 RepID=UPI0004CB1627|nr:hypothetical protein [Streptomyces aureocirculatus]